MKKTILAFLSALASSCFAATSISQYGITWTWTEDLTVGQYANGDYYVVAPDGITITDITPASTLISGRTINGSMANPTAGSNAPQGFDSGANSNTFIAALNVARPGNNDLSAENPLVLSAGTSLVSCISHPVAGTRPQLTDAAVLTIVATAPAEGSFRPPYCGSDKTVLGTVDDLDYGLLQTYAPVASTPSLSTVIGYFARPWIEVNTNFGGRLLHPSNNQPNYGADMTNQLASGMLSLLLSYTNEQKEPLYRNIVQYGIDVYGAAKSGGNWVANGGHDMGRKMPMLLAGLTFANAEILSYSPNIFQEDQQTFVVSQDSVDITHSEDWNPDLRGYESVVTISHASPAVVGWDDHGLIADSMVELSVAGGTLPPPLASGTQYFVLETGLTEDSFSLSLTRGGSAINTTGAGSGVFEAMAGTPYVTDDIGIPEWGIRHASSPELDNADWQAIYRPINYNPLFGHALFGLLVPGAYEAWDHDVFFDYHDRAWAHPNRGTVYKNAFADNMWTAYRNPPTGPRLVSAAIGTGGSSVTYTFDVSVSIGTGGNGGMTIDPSGGGATLTYASGAPGTALVYNTSRTVLAGESILSSYTQPGDGIEATVGGEDLSSFSGALVTNNSTQQQPAAMSNGSRQRLFPGGGGF